jgi:putative transposase
MGDNMPRPLRIEYCGAWYHVMNRGINRMKIYLNDEHREIFLCLLEEISILFEIRIHGYCLMSNHYHLLLEAPHANLSKAMRHLNGIYTQRFNRLGNRDGALFRGRYKAILIEAEDYILKVSRYIHLNPFEANIVEDPNYYEWSSYRYYTTTSRPPWLCTDYILSFFSTTKDFIEFVVEGNDVELNKFYKSALMSPILGGKKFADEKIRTLNTEYKMAASADVNRATKLYKIDKICYLVAKYFDIEIKTLNKTYKNNHPRMFAIYFARNLTQLTHQKIADFFNGIKRASISTVIVRCRKLIDKDLRIKKHYLNLIEIMQDES